MYFLAKVGIYDPKFKFQFDWKNIGKIGLLEFKSIILESIENGDDIYTQFADMEYLVNIVNESKSIEEIFEIIKRDIWKDFID